VYWLQILKLKVDVTVYDLLDVSSSSVILESIKN
jgi:hypothetical protein